MEKPINRWGGLIILAVICAVPIICILIPSDVSEDSRQFIFKVERIDAAATMVIASEVGTGRRFVVQLDRNGNVPFDGEIWLVQVKRYGRRPPNYMAIFLEKK